MIIHPVYIVDEFREIVEKVSQRLTPTLQEFDHNITGVHYLHGHPLEIIETLGQRDKSKTMLFDKYPLVAVFQDFPERVAEEPGTISEVTLHLIVARATSPSYKATERYEHNFKPVLYPVYYELLKEIHLSRAFRTMSPTLIRHTKIDRLYWGREGLGKNQGNIFNDWIDCIEIKDLKLKVNLKLC